MAQHPFFAALEAGSSVVTGNDRLARHLQDQYATSQLQAGLTAWVRPQIMSWQAFLNELADHWWLDQADMPKRMSSAAAAALWEKLVLESSPVPILQPAATARNLQNAWQTLHAALLDETSVKPETPDCRAFIAWAGKFRRYCQKAELIDAARLPDLLAQFVVDRKPIGLGRIALSGFLELTAQQQNFLAAWESAGGEWELVDPLIELANIKTGVAGFSNADDECAALAVWTRKILRTKPAARIGIVVPDLPALRSSIQRQLTRQLIPASRVAAVVEQPPFNFSAGESLRDQAMIRDALVALSLGENIDYRDAGRLLRSPFFGNDVERQFEHLRLDKMLRKSGRHSFNIRFFTDSAERHASGLAQRLKDLLSLRAKQPTHQGTGVWARCFSDELKLLGWSQGRSLNSDEYQLREAWYGLLGEFSCLDPVLQNIDRARALSSLARLAAAKVFQVHTDIAPVQVLGLLEAIGLQFDHLWVMGLTDTNWPQSARPNPFLPIRLQREHGLPHASATKEREFAAKLMHMLQRSAPDVVFSFPRLEQDRVLRPSPLLAGLPEKDFASGLKDPSAAKMLGSTTLEEYTDETAPALGDNELQRGGTSVITDMAACPFRAFATARLRATEESFPDSGLNAAERGDLLHILLKKIWDELGDQQTLLNLSEQESEALVMRQVNDLLKERYGSSSQLSKIFLETEAQRLIRLAMQWLVVERDRSVFTVIDREVTVDMEIGPLTLQGTIDRMDELNNGERILIDYKTGQASINDWAGERPNAPQLPLYAVTRDRFPDVVAFARVKTGDNQFEGLASDENLLANVTPLSAWRKRPEELDKWADLNEYWRLNLTNLSVRFAQGDATVDPKTPNKTCSFCHLSTLCRIDEKSRSRRGFSGSIEDE